MKFMKVGSKPDSFYSVDNTRTVASEISTDIVILVKDTKFLLHKFPLLSKCGKLQVLASEIRQPKDYSFELHDIPGGVEAFEICAKFCYGIQITISALNIVLVRCAAEYLLMNEDQEMGNLICKLDIFLNTCILHSWKDSICTLKTTKSFLPWSEELNIVGRCIDAITSRALVNPSKVDWSYTYSRHETPRQVKSQSSGNAASNKTHGIVPKDWWVEDITDLELDHYWRVMVAIKSTGKFSARLIGEALKVFAYRWLPGMSQDSEQDSIAESSNEALKHVHLLETIVSLLPQKKGSVSCSFLLKLLRASIALKASASLKLELTKRIGVQLEEASLSDILIPSSSSSETVYDVDLILSIVEHFKAQESFPASSISTVPVHEKISKSAEIFDLTEAKKITVASHSALLKVANLIDSYLVEIACDVNLSVLKFLTLAETMPDFARPVHDQLYKAIDIFLQEHPWLTKTERKRICKLLDCKKLSTEVCMHAAQNECLPLRTVVQVLFHEQIRSALPGIGELPSDVKGLASSQGGVSQDAGNSSSCDEGWESVQQNFNSLRGDLEKMKLQLEEVEKERNDLRQEVKKNTKSKGIRIFPRRLLSKLWSGNQGTVIEKF